MDDLSWSDTMWFDNDSDVYVYYGTWEWSFIDSSKPFDNIGVTTSDKSNMPINNVIVRGYNSWGTQTAYYSTSTGQHSGHIQLSTPRTNTQGKGFWIDERYVKRGTVTAFLSDQLASTTNEAVYLQYNHGYTDRVVDGVGGDVDIKAGGGFQVTWHVYVSEDGPFYSNGASNQ